MIFVCHLQHSAPRAPGWYWWVEGDDHKVGPFDTEAQAHTDIGLVSQEADGR